MTTLNVSLHIDGNLNADSDDTVIFIEGIGANLKGWDLFVEPFATRYNVVRYDHPCAGKSLPYPGYTISAQDFIESLEYVLGNIKGRIHLVGYSLGGLVIFRWLCNKADSVNYDKVVKSVTIGAGFPNISDELARGFNATKETLLNEEAKSSHINSLSFLYDTESLRNKSFRDYLENRCLDDKDFITSRNFISQIDACLSSNEWREFPHQNNKFQIPLLLMYAEDDRIINPHHTLLLKEYFSNVSVHSFPHGGHCFKDVHREIFIQLILDHIAAQNIR